MLYQILHTDFYFPESNAIAKGIAPIEAYDRYHTQVGLDLYHFVPGLPADKPENPKAMTNWAGGEKADGTGPLAHTPNVYGTSFQSLNVAQKLQNNAALDGGYLAGNVPNTATQSALSFLGSLTTYICPNSPEDGFAVFCFSPDRCYHRCSESIRYLPGKQGASPIAMPVISKY